MTQPYDIRFLGLIIVLLIILGCASGGVRETESPTISEAQAVSATGPKARIAVAQFVNNTGGFEAQMQRMAAQMQAQSINLGREMIEFQKKMIPYQQALAAWQAKVSEVGQEAAGPPTEPPEFSTSSSPYMVTVTDPVAGGIRDMMINAVFNCGRFIVLERQAIDRINWEQEFSQTPRVGEKTRIPVGEIEGAELLLIGSLNTLEAKQSGGDIGGVISSTMAVLPILDLPYTTEATEAQISWESAKVAMDLRLVDTRTARVVAAATVEGSAKSVGFGASKTEYTYNAGELPKGFSIYHKTPVEKAFRKMVDAAVEFLVSKTPERYYHD